MPHKKSRRTAQTPGPETHLKAFPGAKIVESGGGAFRTAILAILQRKWLLAWWPRKATCHNSKSKCDIHVGKPKPKCHNLKSYCDTRGGHPNQSDTIQKSSSLVFCFSHHNQAAALETTASRLSIELRGFCFSHQNQASAIVASASSLSIEVHGCAFHTA